MVCSFKDPETGKACGVKTSINPKTNEPFEYCGRCFIQMKRNRQERFIDASRKAIDKKECRWIGNYNGKNPFRVKCIELPTHNGWCALHKDSVETIAEPVKGKKITKVDDELNDFVNDITTKKDKKGKLKALAENPELSEEDNIVVVSKGKQRETKQKPTKVEDDQESEETQKVEKQKKKSPPKESKKSKDEDVVVVKKGKKSIK